MERSCAERLPPSPQSSPGSTGRSSIPEAVVLNRDASGYGFPAFARDDSGEAWSSIPAARFARAMRFIVPRKTGGRRECRCAVAPAASCARVENAHEWSQVHRTQSGGFKRSSQHHAFTHAAIRQALRWCSPAERLSRPGIESRGHCGYLVHAVDARSVPFGKYCRSSRWCSRLWRCTGSWIAKVDLDSASILRRLC